MPLKLFVIKPVEAREQGTDHPVLDAIKATPEYLPDPKGLTKPMHRGAGSDLREFAPALRRCVRKRPRGVARATRTAIAQSFRDRRGTLSGPRKIYIKELIQAITLADRLNRPDVRHLHAHFAHGTTTITWLAACITGLPFSFTGHARDIYAPELNPKGWLKRKLNAARFVVTCTEANVAHLRRDRPQGEHPPRLPRPLGRLHEPPRSRTLAAPQRNGHLRVLGVGRLVAKKGFDTLVEACAVLQRARRAVRGADRRPGRQARRRDPPPHRGARRPGRAARRRRPGEAARRVPPRRRAVHAVQAAGQRPRRHPERARRGDGRGRARRRHQRLRHPRAGRSTRSTAC